MKKIALLFGVLSLPFAASAQAGAAGLNWGNSAGSASSDESRCVAVDGSDYSYYSGYFTGTVDFDPGAGTQNLTSQGGRDIYIAKYDPNGAFVWATRIGGTNNEFGTSIKVDGSGNIYLTGNFRGTVDFDPGAGVANLVANGLWEDVFVAKYNNSGSYQWAFKIGSNMTDNGLSLVLDGSSNVYVAGNFYGTTDFNPGAGNYNLTPNTDGNIVYPAGFVAKYNSSGTFEWAFKINSTKVTNCTALVHDGTSYLYVTGNFAATADFDPSASVANKTSAGSSDAFLAKYSSASTYQWAGEIGGTTADAGTALTYDGSYVYIAGDFTGTADFIPGPGYLPFTSFGGTDIFLGRYELNGTCFWIKQIGGANEEHCNSIDSKDGYIFTTGWFDGLCDFDPTPMDYSLQSAGKEDIFIAIYECATSFITYATRFGGSTADIGYGIDASGSWSFWLSAKYMQANINFDPMGFIPPYSSVNNSNDCMMARYYWGIILGGRQQESPAVNAEVERVDKVDFDRVQIAYYPNPASSVLILENVPEGAVIELFSTTGQRMLNVPVNETGLLRLDVSNYPDGMYILRIAEAEGILSDEKIIIQH